MCFHTRHSVFEPTLNQRRPRTDGSSNGNKKPPRLLCGRCGVSFAWWEFVMDDSQRYAQNAHWNFFLDAALIVTVVVLAVALVLFLI
jgi:hypothetical protein